MDNELGMEYMKQHFEPHTQRVIPRDRLGIAGERQDAQEVVTGILIIE